MPTALLAAWFLAAGCRTSDHGFRTGLEVLAAEDFARLRGRKVALVTNPTGIDREFRSLVDLVATADGVELVAILGPEHGARGAAEAGVEVGYDVDARTGVPVHSLYGKVKKPTAAMLGAADVILFDIQDIGVRTYTYLATLVRVMEAAAELGREVWVLDRPVPIGGGRWGGPVLDARLESFVGPHPVPLRHALTAGEFALLANAEREIGAELTVVRMEGYRRDEWYEDTELPWIAPSPNIPTVETALVYAGTVLVEGVATLSEGRGTTRPFRLIGAPWIDAYDLVTALGDARTGGAPLRGVRFREAYFTPTFSKHEGELCAGVEIFVTDRDAYRPIETAIALIATVRKLWPEEFRWRERSFDLLAGTSALREAIEAGRSLDEIRAQWREALEEFAVRRARVLLYE